jgi:hypothetical protein
VAHALSIAEHLAALIRLRYERGMSEAPPDGLQIRFIDADEMRASVRFQL